MQQGLLSAVAYGILGLAMAMGQEAVAQTTCTVPPNSNNGVVQNGPPPCVVGDLTVGYGTAVTATNGADVTVNGAVTAHGYGTGVDANTNSRVIINNSVRTTAVGPDRANYRKWIRTQLKLLSTNRGQRNQTEQ